MTDKNIIRLYNQGFHDQLYNKFDNLKVDSSIGGRAYNLGSLHAIVGDDCRSVDYLSDKQIVEILRKKR